MNEYWIVTDNRTGRVISHCGDITDAIMMVGFDPNHRTYSRHRYIMDQVIDITSTTDKQLPGQIGLPLGKIDSLNSYKEKLPDRMEEPFIP
jgi:hypothetical protein